MKRNDLEDKIELHIWRTENNASENSPENKIAVEIVQYLIDNDLVALDDAFKPSGN